MNSELQKLNKSQLLSIISQMKKKELIEIINNKNGGGENVNRIAIKYDKSKNKENLKETMENNKEYNSLYNKEYNNLYNKKY